MFLCFSVTSHWNYFTLVVREIQCKITVTHGKHRQMDSLNKFPLYFHFTLLNPVCKHANCTHTKHVWKLCSRLNFSDTGLFYCFIGWYFTTWAVIPIFFNVQVLKFDVLLWQKNNGVILTCLLINVIRFLAICGTCTAWWMKLYTPCIDTKMRFNAWIHKYSHLFGLYVQCNLFVTRHRDADVTHKVTSALIIKSIKNLEH